MIVQLGESGTTINMLQACYWKVLVSIEGSEIYQLVFSGDTPLVLSKAESAAFKQFLERSSQPSLIQPVGHAGFVTR